MKKVFLSAKVLCAALKRKIQKSGDCLKEYADRQGRSTSRPPPAARERNGTGQDGMGGVALTWWNPSRKELLLKSSPNFCFPSASPSSHSTCEASKNASRSSLRRDRISLLTYRHSPATQKQAPRQVRSGRVSASGGPVPSKTVTAAAAAAEGLRESRSTVSENRDRCGRQAKLTTLEAEDEYTPSWHDPADSEDSAPHTQRERHYKHCHRHHHTLQPPQPQREEPLTGDTADFELVIVGRQGGQRGGGQGMQLHVRQGLHHEAESFQELVLQDAIAIAIAVAEVGQRLVAQALQSERFFGGFHGGYGLGQVAIRAGRRR